MDGLVLGAARFYPLHRAAHCAVVVQPEMPADLCKTLPAVASNQVVPLFIRPPAFFLPWIQDSYLGCNFFQDLWMGFGDLEQCSGCPGRFAPALFPLFESAPGYAKD
jgi:hypothetical protein